MKKRFVVKILIFLIMCISIIIASTEVEAGEIKQTWRTNPNSNLQEISLEVISGAQYSKNYGWSFVNYINNGWSGKTVYGGGLQGSVVTERHIIFAVLSGGRQNGYIYVANKTTGAIEQSIPVANAGSTSLYGHMNDMAYNPKTKEVFLPYGNKIAIFKYNSNGSLNTTPTIANQKDMSCGNMDYNTSMDRYILNSGTNVYITHRQGNDFICEKKLTYDQMDFKYMTPQSFATNGKYFYKIFSENGEIDESIQPTYADYKEQFSGIAAVYEIETGKFVKAIYIPNTEVAAELEGISFDPQDGSMMLSYNYYEAEKVKFYKLKTGNQVIGDREQYFYSNGFVAPKATITAEKDGIGENLIRYYNGTNNLIDGHSNYSKSWKDLAGQYNGNVNGGASFSTEGYLNLNSDNKWVNIGQMPNTIYNHVTIEAGVAFHEIQDGEVDLISNMESGGYALLMVDGQPAFQAFVDGNYQSVKFDEKLLPNRLYNITGVFDGNNLKLYIDGVLRCSKKVGNNTTVKEPGNNTVMAIGANPNGNNAAGGFMKGVVYSVRIYQSALNDDQIKKNMNADRVTNNTVFSDSSDKVGITINFSEPVSNFTADDIVVKNGKKGNLVKNTDKQYIIEITDIKEGANLEISIVDGTFTDLTGNKGIGAKVERNRDATGPIATIVADKEDITKEKNITYTITFNEKVTGFDVNDIIINNGTKKEFKEVEERKVYTLSVSKDNEEGQEITIPEGTVYDANGNGNLKIVKEYKAKTENLEVKIIVNEVTEENEKKYIENINPNTTIESLKKNIKTNGEIKVYNGSNLIIDEKELIGTGMKIKISFKEQEEMYTTIIKGDLTGNGEMGIVDLLKLSRYIANIDKTLNKEHLKASNIMKDERYGDILDLLKMSRILAGLEQI